MEGIDIAGIPRLRECYLPLFPFGHMRIRGVTLRHSERRGLMLFELRILDREITDASSVRLALPRRSACSWEST